MATLQRIPGLSYVILPDEAFAMPNLGPSFSAVTLDATGEATYGIGRVVWADGSSHTISSSGGKIGWMAGAGVTWADAGSVLKVGLQDIDAASGPPGRGDLTFDVSASLVPGTETVASSTWYETAMETGTKTLATGDPIAIAVEFTTRAGADVVTVNRIATGATWSSPASTTFLGGSYAAATTQLPNFTLIADDGTYGTLMGTAPCAVPYTLVGAFNNASATKEYGNLFSLPFNCEILGMYANFSDGNTAATAEFNLYTDPTNIGEGVTEVAEALYPARSGRGNANAGVTYGIFSTPYTYTANTLMAMAARPTSASNVNLAYFEANLNAAWAAHPLGTQCYAVSRNTVSSATAFGTFSSTARRMIMGLLISKFPGPDDALIVPNITRNIFLEGTT